MHQIAHDGRTVLLSKTEDIWNESPFFLHLFLYYLQVVMEVTEPYLNCGRVLCTDNWYTSMELVEQLQAHDTHLVGTYRKNRKNLPREVVQAKLKKGEIKAMSETRTGTIALKWKDKRDVFVLSTTHGLDMQPVQRRRNTVAGG